MFAFPHGIHVDNEGNVWVTDPLPVDGRGAGGNVVSRSRSSIGKAKCS
jgi:NHL repeat-containing protein